jgi:hypothetical protein
MAATPAEEPTMQPTDPVAAVTHPDPYPYYATLRQRPLHRDEALGLWVAAGAETAMAVLASPACRVRPPAEPVPPPLRGGAAGDLFGRLVRMTDGDSQARAKRAVAAALDVPAETVMAEARRWSTSLAADRAGLDAFLFALPMHVVGARCWASPRTNCPRSPAGCATWSPPLPPAPRPRRSGAATRRRPEWSA